MKVDGSISSQHYGILKRHRGRPRGPDKWPNRDVFIEEAKRRFMASPIWRKKATQEVITEMMDLKDIKTLRSTLDWHKVDWYWLKEQLIKMN